MMKNIYPTPQKIVTTSGRFAFGTEVTIKYSKDFLKTDSFGILAELWTNFTCGASSVKFEKDGDETGFLWKIGDTEAPQLTEEYTYILSVTPKGAAIRAYDDISVIHGFFTLLQLISYENLQRGEEAFYINSVTIADAPQLKFRCKHIAVLKGMTLEQLKKYIRFSAFMKYSHIMLEFYGNLKFDCLPELSWQDAYSKEEFAPLIKEARLLGVEIIPLFNSLGHAGMGGLMDGINVVLDQNPRHALLFEPDGWSFCLSNPDTLNLIRNARNELIELCGPGSYFHIGLDESHDFATCDRCSGFDKGEMLADFVNQTARELKSVGRRTMVWGDMLLYREQFDPEHIYRTGKHFPVANASDHMPTHKALDKIDHDVIITDWQYYINDKENPTAKYISQKGFDVITASWNNFENMHILSACAGENNYFGYMSTSWGELVNNADLILYNAELAWNAKRADAIDTHRLETRFYAVSAIQRKLCPPMGVYENSGWR